MDLILTNANLSDADLTGADLSYAIYLGTTIGSPYYNAGTDFTPAFSGAYGGSALFDPVAAGWTFIPEPSTALLLGVGLAGMGMSRRC